MRKSAKGEIVFNNIANIITVSRIIFAAGIVLTSPFSAAFWICYICGGISDIIDGLAARKLKQQSETGAKLDSVADLIFAIAIAVVATVNIKIPVWLYLFACGIALLRIAGYIIGFFKYHTFSSLHTYANKAAGTCIFAFPLLYALFGLPTAGAILSVVAIISSVEEIIITLKSKSLNRDCKSLITL